MNIVFFSGFGFWKALHSQAHLEPGSMLGGGETALVELSTRLAKRNHAVTVIADVKAEGLEGGVNWMRRPPDGQLGDFEVPACDVFIACDAPTAVQRARRARVRILDCQNNHFTVTGIAPLIDWYVARSGWHRDHLSSLDPAWNVAHTLVLPNGISAERYAGLEDVDRDLQRVIHTSSPDRGLRHLLRFWPEVRKRAPGVTLHIYYEIQRQFASQKWFMSLQGQMWWEMMEILEHADELGVVHHGGVDQNTLAREQTGAALLAYPCDTVAPTEGFSMSIGEAVLAGCETLISDCDALGEVWGPYTNVLPLPIDPDAWVAGVVQLLEDWRLPVAVERRAKALEAVKERYGWERVVDRWEGVLARMLTEPATLHALA